MGYLGTCLRLSAATGLRYVCQGWCEQPLTALVGFVAVYCIVPSGAFSAATGDCGELGAQPMVPQPPGSFG